MIMMTLGLNPTHRTILLNNYIPKFGGCGTPATALFYPHSNLSTSDVQACHDDDEREKVEHYEIFLGVVSRSAVTGVEKRLGRRLIIHGRVPLHSVASTIDIVSGALVLRIEKKEESCSNRTDFAAVDGDADASRFSIDK